MARVNALLAELVAEALERIADTDDRLPLLTVTGVDCEADLRRAAVYLDSVPEGCSEALEEARVRLQAAIGRQAHLKRTPQLHFCQDPATVAAQVIEEALRRAAERGGGFTKEATEGSEGSDVGEEGDGRG